MFAVKCRARGLILLGALLPAYLPARVAPGRVEVTVDSSVTAAGKNIRAPSPRNPTYYIPILEKFQTEGTLVEGESEPDSHAVAHLTAKELSLQGYRVMDLSPNLNEQGEVIFADKTPVTVPRQYDPKKPFVLNQNGNIPLTAAMLHASTGDYSLDNPKPCLMPNGAKLIDEILKTVDPAHGAVASGSPTQVLAINYGYVNSDVSEFADTQKIPDLGQTTNGNQHAEFGEAESGKSNAINFSLDKGPIHRALVKHYFIVITAFDYRAWAKARRRVVLWETKISADASKVPDFAKIMMPMLVTGGRTFGRNLSHPQIFQVSDALPWGRVKVGSAKNVQPDSDTPDSPGESSVVLVPR